jgi:autotransporter-associated beta strand protein
MGNNIARSVGQQTAIEEREMSSKAWAADPWRQRISIALAAGMLLCATAAEVLAQTRALGLDISAWQGNISQTTWNNFRNVENRQFVFLRSSRGGTTGYYNQNNSDNDPPTNTLSQRYDDPYFVQNITRATNAGMFAGSYHFSRPDIIASTLNAGGIANSGADEADHFLQMAGAWMRPGYLLPVHDLEAGDGIRTDNEMAQFTLDFSNRIYEVMGIRPAVYINGNYAQNIIGGASAALRNQVVSTHPTLWSARWPNQSNPNSIDVQNGEPKDSFANIYGPWDDSGVTHPWSFWQYASTGRLQSFNNGGSNLDFDVAKGGVEFLKDNLVPALWWNDSDGDWSTLANWNSGQAPVAPVQGPGQVARVGSLTLPSVRLPGAAGSGVNSGQNDTVILDRPNANVTVTLSTGTHNIRKLYAREALNIMGGSLNVNYTPSADSTPIAGQFSAPVNLSGGSLSIHTLLVDATQTFTLSGGSLTLNALQLLPHGTTPAKLQVSGDVGIQPLANAAASIVNGAGAGSTGVVDLGGASRALDIGEGAAAFDLSINVPVTNGGLTKAGPGSLALNAANTYAGDTTVDAGLLRLASAFLSDASDVYLSSGAILDLNTGGATDVIDSLFIDGVSQAQGIWGAIGSGAEFTSDLITGNGLLQVSTFVAPPLWGDYNDDGIIDAGDYVVWRDAMEAGTPLLNDDTLGVGEDDYDRWRMNFGQTNLGAGAVAGPAVPEPSSASLLWMAGGAGGVLHRLAHRRRLAGCCFRPTPRFRSHCIHGAQ